MKILIFAHVPPPLHGQSYMVETMLTGLGGDCRARRADDSSPKLPGNSLGLQLYHVDARLSDELEMVGAFQVRKLFRILSLCCEAIWCRLREGADIFYYIPAPPRRAPFLRDCLVLLICRPFFKKVLFHWHACGLGEWLQSEASPVERWIGRLLLRDPDISIVLCGSLSGDARYFVSRQIAVVPNGIPDRCPSFESMLLPERRKRRARFEEISDPNVIPPPEPEIYRVLFLAHCTREKGLFDSLVAVDLANRELASRGLAWRMHLTVAGAFRWEAERAEFEHWRQEHRDQLHFAGFVDAAAKDKLLQESDCLCFPSYYFAEAQPVAILEAMAFGLTVVASQWRGIPAMLPENYPHLVPAHDPAVLARALLEAMRSDWSESLRARFCACFTTARHLERLTFAFEQVQG